MRKSLMKAWIHSSCHGRNDQEESSFTPSRSVLSRPNLRACVFFWNTVFQDDGHTDFVVCLILYVSLASTAGNCFRNKWLSRWPNLWVSCSVVRAVAVWSDHQQFFSVYLRWVIWVTSLALHEMRVLSEIAPPKIASCIQDFFYLNYWRGVLFCFLPGWG